MAEKYTLLGNNMLSKAEYDALLSHLHVMRVEGGDIRSYALVSRLEIAPAKPMTGDQVVKLLEAVRIGRRATSPEGERAATAILTMMPMPNRETDE